MSYLINEYQIQQIISGRMKVSEIMNPEGIALLTWTGADVRMIIERRIAQDGWKEGKKYLEPEKFEELVNEIVHYMEHCQCAECVELAVESAVDEVLKEK